MITVLNAKATSAWTIMARRICLVVTETSVVPKVTCPLSEW
nr:MULTISPECIES: hypothetical protein [Arsenicicoccus]